MIHPESPPLILFAGPCVVESVDVCLTIAEALAAAASRHSGTVEAVFKSSIDKANRTSVHSFRGHGLEHGLRDSGQGEGGDGASDHH